MKMEFLQQKNKKMTENPYNQVEVPFKLIFYMLLCPVSLMMIFVQEFQLDSRELTCKLSGLEMDTGRSNDSGVASPSEETGEAGDKESGARRSGGKSRTESGEDAGIGSEQGENNMILN